MASARLLSALPAPRHQDPFLGPTLGAGVQNQSRALVAPSKHKEPPPYGRRQGFVPRKVEDFGDGGAFPEIHVAQYPLDMGKKEQRGDSKTLPLNVDKDGNIAYDAIVKQGQNASKVVHSQHSALVPKLHDVTEAELRRPDEEEIADATEKTRAALEKVVNKKISSASNVLGAPKAKEAPTYIKYTPSQQGAAFNSGAKERVIRMIEAPVDPLEPPKFKHKKVPKGPGSPPVPVMHSPPRAVTVRDQQDWKIPPSISNWKNPKGYTIPLDKRLAADGRSLQDVQINDNFAKLAEALYVAEQKAREAVEMRSKIQRELMLKEKEKKEQELRALAQRARMERAGGVALRAEEAGVIERAEAVPEAGETREEREERMRRDALREERKRDRERDRRLEAKEGHGAKKSKLTRDRERDISEKVALGQANVTGGGEVMYDQRLFNQEQGMESGFAAEDQYNIYDKGLFAGERPSVSGLFRPSKNADDELYGGEGALDKLANTDRFKPDKGFAGATESAGPRDRPVEFEANEAEADPFGLDQFLTEVRKGKKLDKVGASGTMRASGGGGGNYDGGSNRSRVDFERGR